MQSSNKIAITYSRVSTEEQAEYGFSLAHQKEALERYCLLHDITILRHFTDDCSGKDFNRPEFQKLLKIAKEKRNKVDYLLFTKWDRFGRNLVESFKMIEVFKKLGITVNSIEQQIDLRNPDSLLMLAIVNTSPEVERLKISQRTRDGMRKAQKEGYWVTRAPIGYEKFKLEDEKRVIIRPSNQAPIIKEIFIEFSKGIYAIEELRTIFAKKGFKSSKQGFIHLLTNITYTGKSKIAAFGEEPEMIVDGLHESIINQETFDKVQAALNGRRWQYNKIEDKSIYFPLRGFLLCKRCGQKLTASVNPSHTGNKYHYYHCQKNCKERFRAADAHNHFLKFLKKLQPKPEHKQHYIKILKNIYSTEESNSKVRAKRLENELEKLNYQIEITQDKYISGDIDKGLYQTAIARYEVKKSNLESDYSMQSNNEFLFDKHIMSNLTLLENIADFYENADLSNKRKLLDILFPEKIIFTGDSYLNHPDNLFVKYISLNFNDLKGKKKEKVGKNTDQSNQAPPLGLEPRTL